MRVRVLHGEALGCRDAEQCDVGADEDRRHAAGSQIVVAPRESGCELHGVVGAQRVHAAEDAGARENGAGDTHNDVLTTDQAIEQGDMPVAIGAAEPSRSFMHHAAQTRYDLNQRQLRDDNRVACRGIAQGFYPIDVPTP